MDKNDGDQAWIIHRILISSTQIKNGYGRGLQDFVPRRLCILNPCLVMTLQKVTPTKHGKRDGDHFSTQNRWLADIAADPDALRTVCPGLTVAPGARGPIPPRRERGCSEHGPGKRRGLGEGGCTFTPGHCALEEMRPAAVPDPPSWIPRADCADSTRWEVYQFSVHYETVAGLPRLCRAECQTTLTSF